MDSGSCFLDKKVRFFLIFFIVGGMLFSSLCKNAELIASEGDSERMHCVKDALFGNDSPCAHAA